MSGYRVLPLTKLIEQFEALPSIGRKSAQRLAYHILQMPEERAQKFVQAILDAREQIHYCSVCQNFTDSDICSVCTDTERDKSVICVVEDPRAVIAIENTGHFGGTYHVLHGAISPMKGVSPDDLKIPELLSRLNTEEVTEVILATNPTIEGEATAMYLSRLISPLGIKVSRIANGVPIGGDLEYADEVTLRRAIEGRYEL